MSNKENYVDAFVTVFGVEEGELNENFSSDGSEKWNSMSHIELISELEDRFNILVDPDDIIELTSFDKGIEILKKYDIEI